MVKIYDHGSLVNFSMACREQEARKRGVPVNSLMTRIKDGEPITCTKKAYFDLLARQKEITEPSARSIAVKASQDERYLACCESLGRSDMFMDSLATTTGYTSYSRREDKGYLDRQIRIFVNQTVSLYEACKQLSKQKAPLERDERNLRGRDSAILDELRSLEKIVKGDKDILNQLEGLRLKHSGPVSIYHQIEGATGKRSSAQYGIYRRELRLGNMYFEYVLSQIEGLTDSQIEEKTLQNYATAIRGVLQQGDDYITDEESKPPQETIDRLGKMLEWRGEIYMQIRPVLIQSGIIKPPQDSPPVAPKVPYVPSTPSSRMATAPRRERR